MDKNLLEQPKKENAIKAVPEQGNIATISDMIMKQKSAIAMVINGSTEEERKKNAERFARIAITEIRKQPQLAECSPTSFMGSLMMCAQLQLEPGPLGHAYLVPYRGECQFQVGYQGLIELAYRSGKVKSIYAEVVYTKEVESGQFYYSMGLNRTLSHNIDLLGDSRGGELIAVYAVAELLDGVKSFVVLSKTEIDLAKKKSQSLAGQNPQYSPWNTSPEEMWKKTAVKRLSKYIPKSIEMAQAIELDDVAETGDVQIFDAESLPFPETATQKLSNALDQKLTNQGK